MNEQPLPLKYTPGNTEKQDIARRCLYPQVYSRAMDKAQLAHLRLHAQGIAATAWTTPGEVVAGLGAVQAQDYLGALWAIGLRMRRATEPAVEAAIVERTIVRTWPMRGTLHFVAAADVRWMLELLAPRVVANTARRYQQLELDDRTFARSRELFTEALGGGKQLSRPAMYQVLEAAGIPTAGQRGIHILSRLAHEGLLCFGAREGKQPTFVLLDEWVSGTPRLDHDEALAELARRYFTGHGPATVPDLMWWSGLPATDARAALAMAKAGLDHVEVDGQTYWMGLEVSSGGGSPATLHLLAPFDEYLLGYRDRSAVLDPLHATKVNPGNNGMFSPTIMVGGRIVGTWKRVIKRNAVVITSHPFDTLAEDELDAFAAAAEEYAAFLGMAGSVSIPLPDLSGDEAFSKDNDSSPTFA